MSLVVVLGGTRSGKSAFAEKLAARAGNERVLYVATAMGVGEDPELALRVREHRERRPAGWGTLELGGGDPGRVLVEAAPWEAVLFDSLTLWAAARMFENESDGDIIVVFEGFLAEAVVSSTPVILVSDEVGLGVVPESAEGRRFRDLLGSLNQRAAAAASEVHLCVAGLPIKLK